MDKDKDDGGGVLKSNLVITEVTHVLPGGREHRHEHCPGGDAWPCNGGTGPMRVTTRTLPIPNLEDNYIPTVVNGIVEADRLLAAIHWCGTAITVSSIVQANDYAPFVYRTIDDYVGSLRLDWTGTSDSWVHPSGQQWNIVFDSKESLLELMKELIAAYLA